jgi:hypothetical protein
LKSQKIQETTVKSANPRLEIVEVIPNRTNFGQS